ncbi:MAG: cytochrome P450 [Xenococcaceae cyanobacterium MO_188.B29]|nr:cytochrome P450 [Xenococcaceae cyanobacterium MO_188.B29]
MKQIEGSKILPAIQLYHWIMNPLGFLEECVQKYGDTFNLNLLGFPPFTIVSHPQANQEIFSVDSRQFDAGRGNGLIRVLVGDNSLFLMDGDRHKRERKLLMPPFHGEKVKSYAQTICDIAAVAASQWQTRQPFKAQKAMQDITLEIILHVVFGLSEGERYQKMKPLIANLLDMVGAPLRASVLFLPILQQDWGAWSPWGQFVRCRQTIYDLLQAEIEERRSQPDSNGNDVLSLMLSARDEDGQPMTDAELKDEMITLLTAGHETTATSLSWAFYWIEKLPKVKEKLLQELDSLPENADPLEVSRLPYLTAVCSETLRIYPVAIIAFPRIARSSVEIMGYHFDTEAMLVPCIYLTHQREDLYPEPKKFRPERFLERQYTPNEFLPFGGGNRRCIGYVLALLKMKLVLATILTKYELTLASDRPVVPRRRGGTIAPHNGVPIILKGKRSRPQPAKTEPIFSQT